MENFGIYEDIDALEDDEDGELDQVQSNSQPKEISGTVDMQKKSEESKSVPQTKAKEPSEDEDIEEDYGQDNEFEANNFEQAKETVEKDTTKPVASAPPKDNFAFEEPDSDKDKDEIYQEKLEKLEQENQNKFEFDIPDDIDNQGDENMPQVSLPKEEIEEQYSEPAEEIEEQYSEPKESIDEKYSEPKEETPKESKDDIKDKIEKEPSKEKTSEEDYEDDFNNKDNESSNNGKSEPDQKSEGNESEPEKPEKVSDKNDSLSSENKDEEHKQSDSGDEKHDKGKKKKHLKFEILEPKSLRIIYDMTAYIGDAEPEDLFNEYIYEQLIKTKTKENMVELILSEDFFTVLKEHNLIKDYKEPEKVEMLDKTKENLQELL